MLQSVAEEKKKNINLLDCVRLFTVEEQLGEEDPWYAVCVSCYLPNACSTHTHDMQV